MLEYFQYYDESGAFTTNRGIIVLRWAISVVQRLRGWLSLGKPSTLWIYANLILDWTIKCLNLIRIIRISCRKTVRVAQFSAISWCCCCCYKLWASLSLLSLPWHTTTTRPAVVTVCLRCWLCEQWSSPTASVATVSSLQSHKAFSSLCYSRSYFYQQYCKSSVVVGGGN